MVTNTDLWIYSREQLNEASGFKLPDGTEILVRPDPGCEDQYVVSVFQGNSMVAIILLSAGTLKR